MKEYCGISALQDRAFIKFDLFSHIKLIHSLVTDHYVNQDKKYDQGSIELVT